MVTKKKDTRGGARPGAGRPKGSVNNSCGYTRLYVPNPILDGIEQIICEYKEIHKKAFS